jgi:hypothetical protein
MALMHAIPHLHASIPHVDKLADLLVLLLPIIPLAILGAAIQGRLALSAEYWSWRSGNAPALQTMQLLSMIAACCWSEE